MNPFKNEIIDGISVFTAIKNRREMLEKSLPTWLVHNQIDEIIVLDWSSGDELSAYIRSLGSPKIIYAKANDQPEWILSFAYNLAARLTSRIKLLKLDADIMLRKDFFREHPLHPGSFYTGNWRTARNDNEKHLHGVSFLFRDDFFRVNGYNEFIKTYGWDDIDLYERLESTGLTHKYLNPDTLQHMEHSGRTGHQDRMKFLKTEDDKEKALLNSLINRFIVESLPKWTNKTNMLKFRIVPSSGNHLECDQDSPDPNVLREDLIQDCESKAIVERFYELGVKIPAVLLKSLPHSELINLLNLFYERNADPEKNSLFNSFLRFASAYSYVTNNLQNTRVELEALKKATSGQRKPSEELNIGISEKKTEILKLQNKIDEIQGSFSWKLGHGIISGVSAVVPGKWKNFRETTPEIRQKDRKVNLGEEVGAFYGQHRSGWGFAIASLAPLHRPDGIILDSFIERTFQWHPKGVHPHKEPWIGFIHVPPATPEWFAPEVSNQTLFNSPAWQESLPFCKGLFTLSAYHRKNLEKKFDFPVNNLFHPTEPPLVKWSYERFMANRQKKVIQVGFWLRKLYAIYALSCPGQFQKVFIRKENVNLDHVLEQERKFSEYGKLLTPEKLSSVETISYLSNPEYDRMLAENIVFIDLYDASANNSVIECMVRNTPILVNPIDPVVEYLGEKYPFYFRNLEEATAKLSDFKLIKETNRYLNKNPNKKRLSSENFLSTFTNSPIYKNL